MTEANQWTLGPLGSVPERDELHLLGLVNALLRQRRLFIATLIVAAAIALTLAYTKERTWTTSTSFLVQGRRTNGLQGLAAQFGINVGVQEGGQSPNLYLDLIRSREILGAVVDSSVTAADRPGVVQPDLGAFFFVKETQPARRRERVVSALRSHVTANIAQRTGVVSFDITTRSPIASEWIAKRMLEELNELNLKIRQSQAAAERRFTTRRLNEVRGELRLAESNLLAFIRRNRDTRNAPDLQVQQDRLQQEVGLRQQLYTTLAQALEQAKIEEVRDTPVISVVEHPIAAALPDGRGTRRLGMIAILLGTLIGTVIALLRDRAQRDEIKGSQESEFSALLAEVVADIKRPWVDLLSLRRS